MSRLAEHHAADRGGLEGVLPEENESFMVTTYTSVEVLDNAGHYWCPL